jgi:hypothetical protein
MEVCPAVTGIQLMHLCGAVILFVVAVYCNYYISTQARVKARDWVICEPYDPIYHPRVIHPQTPRDNNNT